MDLIERPEHVGRRHPWEVARARFFVRLLERTGVLADAAGLGGVLDVGAGDAWLAEQLRAVLAPEARLACWDIHYPDDHPPSSATGSGVIEFSPTRPAGRFGAVLMLDVVEHVEHDVAFVADNVEASLAPGGWVLVSVPAYQSLFSDHDRALRHFRRYAPRALAGVLESAGLAVQLRGGLFHGLLPLRAAQLLRQRRSGPPAPPGPPDPGGPGEGPSAEGVGAWGGGPLLTRALTAALGAETRASLALGARHVAVPGLSTWALCRRAGEDRT